MQNEKSLHTPACGLGALLLAVFLPACGNDSSSGGFQAARETNTSPAMGSGRSNMPPMGSGNGGSIAPAGSMALEWDLPPGWTVAPASSMRAANFKLPGDDKAECYLVLLGGEAGGLESNIDRWRSQMSLPPMPAAEVAALPHVQMLGREGSVVDFAGTWKGMQGTENGANWRLVGVLQVDAEGSAFLKMTGPDALVTAEKEHFLALARSLRPSHAGFGAAADGATPPPVQAQSNPAPAPMPTNPSDPVVASMAGQQQGFTWMAPSTWTKAEDKPARTVTYKTTAGAECYVTVMGGDAGGIAANLSRWRGQLGGAPVSAADVEKLEHLSICGADGRMITIQGEGDSAAKAMLGAMALVGDRSVFVKLTGPKDAVLKESENFKNFAQSLKEAK